MRDLIDRQAAIDAVKDLLDSMLETDTIGFYEIENALFEVPSAQPKQRKRKGRDALGRLIVDGWHLEVRDAEITGGEIPHIIRVGIDGFDHKGTWFTCWLEGEKHE